MQHALLLQKTSYLEFEQLQRAADRRELDAKQRQLEHAAREIKALLADKKGLNAQVAAKDQEQERIILDRAYSGMEALMRAASNMLAAGDLDRADRLRRLSVQVSKHTQDVYPDPGFDDGDAQHDLKPPSQSDTCNLTISRKLAGDKESTDVPVVITVEEVYPSLPRSLVEWEDKEPIRSQLGLASGLVEDLEAAAREIESLTAEKKLQLQHRAEQGGFDRLGGMTSFFGNEQSALTVGKRPLPTPMKAQEKGTEKEANVQPAGKEENIDSQKGRGGRQGGSGAGTDHNEFTVAAGYMFAKNLMDVFRKGLGVGTEASTSARKEGSGFLGVTCGAARGGGIMINALHPGGSAEKSGKVNVSDILLEVDEKPCPATVEKASEMLRGPVGSTVALKLKRTGIFGEDVINVTLTRMHPTAEETKLQGEVAPSNELMASQSDHLCEKEHLAEQEQRFKALVGPKFREEQTAVALAAHNIKELKAENQALERKDSALAKEALQEQSLLRDQDEAMKVLDEVFLKQVVWRIDVQDRWKDVSDF
jgi:hypothetical protein